MTGRPFDPNESDFVSISTGTLAPPDVARHILDGHKKLFGSIRDRLVDKRPKAQFHDVEEAAVQGYCKQRKQCHSTGSQESICSRGPGGREPPSPDERCPFPHTRAIPLAAR